MILNINTDSVVKFTATLEKVRRSAIPNAVRGALNNAAFDVKTKTMPAQAHSRFINRTTTFFRANSRVEMATGFDVNNMKSLVGFYSNNLRSDRGAPGDNFAVRDLEQQEYGKKIPSKSFVPLDSARTGGHNTLVKPKNRLTRILPQNKLIIARNLKGANKKEQFVRAIFKAGAGGYFIGNNKTGSNILWRVDWADEKAEGRKFKITPLYSYRKGRQIKVKERNFMRTASDQSASKMEQFYIAQANYYLSKYAK